MRQHLSLPLRQLRLEHYPCIFLEGARSDGQTHGLPLDPTGRQALNGLLGQLALVEKDLLASADALAHLAHAAYPHCLPALPARPNPKITLSLPNPKPLHRPAANLVSSPQRIGNLL